MLASDQSFNMLEDRSADDLPPGFNRRLAVLLRVEHGIDLELVLLGLLVERSLVGLHLARHLTRLGHLTRVHLRVLRHGLGVHVLHVVGSRLLAVVPWSTSALLLHASLGVHPGPVSNVQLGENQTQRGDQSHKIRALRGHRP